MDSQDDYNIYINWLTNLSSSAISRSIITNSIRCLAHVVGTATGKCAPAGRHEATGKAVTSYSLSAKHLSANRPVCEFAGPRIGVSAQSCPLTWSRWGCRRLADNIWLLAHDNNNNNSRVTELSVREKSCYHCNTLRIFGFTHTVSKIRLI